MKRAGPEDIAVHIVVPIPVTFGIDLVALVLGNPLSVLVNEALEPVLVAHPYEVQLHGKTHLVSPVAFAPGQGGVIPLGRLGQIGIANEDGQLVIVVPATARQFVDQALGKQIAEGTARCLGTRGAREPFMQAMTAYACQPITGTHWMITIAKISIGFIFP